MHCLFYLLNEAADQCLKFSFPLMCNMFPVKSSRSSPGAHGTGAFVLRSFFFLTFARTDNATLYEEESEIESRFSLRTSEEPDEDVCYLVIGKQDTISECGFNASSQTFVIIHGWSVRIIVRLHLIRLADTHKVHFTSLTWRTRFARFCNSRCGIKS